ncbi:MAG: hypothetical protein DRJ61_15740 [Acidobacteria bacterium]|nr:MAG: hypothetical protein DRJ61_15740 [Acidobacteriota bacterium]
MRKAIVLVFVLAVAFLAVASVDAQEVVSCDSKGHDHHYCHVDTYGGVTLVHQRSHSGCWKGDTWGYDSHGIWVSNGCRADFQLGSQRVDWSESMGHHYSSHDNYGGWDNDRDRDQWVDQQVDNAVGNRHKSHHDDAAVAVGAVLAAGIIAAVASDHDDHDRHQTHQDLVTCESKGGDHHYCSVGYFHKAELKRQLSRSQCSYNRTWGYDSHGIWVSQGCRAEFWIDR